MTRMDRTDDFAPTVSAWLHEDARHRAPDDLDAVLRRTRTERQRPAWSSLEGGSPCRQRFASARFRGSPGSS